MESCKDIMSLLNTVTGHIQTRLVIGFANCVLCTNNVTSKCQSLRNKILSFHSQHSLMLACNAFLFRNHLKNSIIPKLSQRIGTFFKKTLLNLLNYYLKILSKNMFTIECQGFRFKQRLYKGKHFLLSLFCNWYL